MTEKDMMNAAQAEMNAESAAVHFREAARMIGQSRMGMAEQCFKDGETCLAEAESAARKVPFYGALYDAGFEKAQAAEKARSENVPYLFHGKPRTSSCKPGESATKFAHDALRHFHGCLEALQGGNTKEAVDERAKGVAALKDATDEAAKVGFCSDITKAQEAMGDVRKAFVRQKKKDE